LQGLTDIQKRLIQLAACCRWFDGGIIREILDSQSVINFEDDIHGYTDAMSGYRIGILSNMFRGNIA
jgi:hypothetical protein